jgi:DNA-3-methyladenine glycosylase
VRGAPRNYFPPLAPEFFLQPTLDLAPALLGKVLIVDHGGGDVRAGQIVETEAYCGPEDLCAHTARGRLSDRNRAMHGPAGHAYIYRIYGIHLCFNVVSGPERTPHAILVRALEPLVGLETMARVFGQPQRSAATFCRGPGLLCRALGITLGHYGQDLRQPGSLYLADGPRPAVQPILRQSVRIGVTGESPWPQMPWRFFWAGHACVSGSARLRRGGS